MGITKTAIKEHTAKSNIATDQAIALNENCVVPFSLESTVSNCNKKLLQNIAPKPNKHT